MREGLLTPVFVTTGGHARWDLDQVLEQLRALRPRATTPDTARVTERACDQSPEGFVLPVEALGVDAQQDLDGLAGPLGDLRGRHAAVEPGRRDARACRRHFARWTPPGAIRRTRACRSPLCYSPVVPRACPNESEQD